MELRRLSRRAGEFSPAPIWAWAALAVLLAAGAVVLVHETRGTVFDADEWTWILHRRQGGVSTFLDPHNGHLSLVPVAIYKLLFATAGIRHYWPYRAVVITAHLGCVTLLFVYLRRRVGGYLALLGAALLLFFGPGWQEFLWPFQIAWLIVLCAAIGALLMLDRDDRLGDAVASVLLAVALASAGPGLAVAVGVTAEIPFGRRWRRLWVVAWPLALYAIWWIGYQQTIVSHDSVFYLTRFVFNAAAGAISSLAGVASPNSVTGGGDFVAGARRCDSWLSLRSAGGFTCSDGFPRVWSASPPPRWRSG